MNPGLLLAGALVFALAAMTIGRQGVRTIDHTEVLAIGFADAMARHHANALRLVAATPSLTGVLTVSTPDQVSASDFASCADSDGVATALVTSRQADPYAVLVALRQRQADRLGICAATTTTTLTCGGTTVTLPCSVAVGTPVIYTKVKP